MRSRRSNHIGPILAAVLVLLVVSLGSALPFPSLNPLRVHNALAKSISPGNPPGSHNPVQIGNITVVAAGDIACKPTATGFNGGAETAGRCRMLATSNIVTALQPSAVLTLGDEQYADGQLSEFQQSFDLSWGYLTSIIHPVPGNHEYHTAGASGYYTYFGTAAGLPGQGYYSYNLGNWHLIALNGECAAVGGCGPNSPQLTWLQSDLAAYSTACILAYWHEPRFSSGHHGDARIYTDFWQALYSVHAEIVLNGHDHDFERFDLQNPQGQADLMGIREFVVGTGGNDLTPFGAVQPNSQVRNNSTFGVLKLTLGLAGYTWQFVPEAGETFSDTGTGVCH